MTVNLGLVAAVAKKVVANALEDKYVTGSILGTGLPVYFNAAISSNAEIYPLMPAIAQGTATSDRVGDKIRPKYMRVDVVITANGSYTSSQINQVRLFILEDKSIRFTPALKDIVATQVGTPISTQLLDFWLNCWGFSRNSQSRHGESKSPKIHGFCRQGKRNFIWFWYNTSSTSVYWNASFCIGPAMYEIFSKNSYT
jgi:hypothetical protein